MNLKKIVLSMLSVATIALAFSACGQAPAVNNAAVNSVNNSNAPAVVNSNPPAANKTVAVSSPAANSNGAAAVNKTPAPTPVAENTEADTVEGELQVGKSESVILYVGMESGDYAAYCFANDSDAGRAILAGCKDKEQCEVKGKFDHEAGCKVPGLEADLSASGRILKVDSAKKSGRKK